MFPIVRGESSRPTASGTKKIEQNTQRASTNRPPICEASEWQKGCATRSRGTIVARGRESKKRCLSSSSFLLLTTVKLTIREKELQIRRRWHHAFKPSLRQVLNHSIEATDNTPNVVLLRPLYGEWHGEGVGGWADTREECGADRYAPCSADGSMDGCRLILLSLLLHTTHRSAAVLLSFCVQSYHIRSSPDRRSPFRLSRKTGA